jgi:hypothetical protein
VCDACQLGRHVRLPFHASGSRSTNAFDLMHCDLWTSPAISVSGYKYYLVILDDYSNFLWTFPLKLKSDTFPTFSYFFAYARTQFGASIKAIQCDNGREFDNSSSTPALALSSSPIVPNFVCLTPTPPLRTVKQSTSFVLQTI